MTYRALIIVALLVFTYGCSDSNNDNGFDLSPVDPVVPPANPIEPTNSSQPEWLYVQTAATAQMTSDTRLEIPFTRDVFGFTDRPNRQHAYFTAYQFASLWNENRTNSFYEDPPNAVLTWLDGEQQREVEMILNSATVYSDGTQESLAYEVTLETEQMPDAQMSYVSLFVDSSQTPIPTWSLLMQNTNSDAFEVSLPVKSSVQSTTISNSPKFSMPAAPVVEADDSNILPKCWFSSPIDAYPQCTFASLTMTGVGGLSFSITDTGGTEYKYSPNAAPGEPFQQSQYCSNNPPQIVNGGALFVEIRQAQIGYGVTVSSYSSTLPSVNNPDIPLPLPTSQLGTSCQASLLSDYDEWEAWCIDNKVACIFAAGAAGAVTGIVIGELVGYAAGYLADDVVIEITQEEATERWVLQVLDSTGTWYE